MPSIKKEIDRLSSTVESNKIVDRKIEIMEAVKEYFERILKEKSQIYSKKLENTIQSLLDIMLEAKRKVNVGTDFSLRVSDSFDDESKSEGQFATVSFAYIGGIFKLLREEEILANKEYPLVLPETLNEIGEYAFYDSGLTEISIPNGVTTIGGNAFGDVMGITDITLPNGLLIIGDKAFSNVQIKTVVVPNSVTSLGAGVFQGCPLESISLPFVGKSRDAVAYEAVFGYILVTRRQRIRNIRLLMVDTWIVLSIDLINLMSL